MNNLKSMLSKSEPVPAVPKSPTQEVETLISAKLPTPLIEYVRDFQHQQAMTTGNVLFSFKDALTAIITAHKENNPVISPRPDAVKAAEKNRGRKKLT
jgi:hypothetical protein